MEPSARPPRLHRLLLRLHPRGFRETYGGAIEETLAGRASEMPSGSGLDRARFWTREAMGLGASLVRERLSPRGSRSHGAYSGARSGLWVSAISREARHALRRLIRAPSFTLPAVLTLGLAIGATTAIFTVIQRIVLAPLPYPDSDRLVALDHGALGIGYPEGMGIPSGVYWQYAQRARTLESVALNASVPMTVSGDGVAESVLVTRATDSFARVIRLEPALGRWFDAAEASPGGRRVAVLSHGLWQRRYGGDPAVIGRTINVAGEPSEVIGVMPADFTPHDVPAELWLPLQLDATNVRVGGFNYRGIGRLAEGATVADARAETSRLIAQLPEDFPGDESVGPMIDDARIVSNIRPLKEHVVGSVARTLWTLFGAVAVVLLVACANVTNLFLVRAENRQREVAVRRALGASRRGIASFFISETLVLGAIGGALGLGLALVGVKLLVALGPADLPRLGEVHVDAAVIGFAAALSIAIALFLGTVPLLRRGPLTGALHEIGRGNTASAGRARARSALMATQVALALVLLIAAGLMAKSFQRLAAVDPGFAPEHAFMYRVILPESSYETRAAAVSFHRQLLERLRAIPGVLAASVTTCPPLSGYCFGDPIGVYGRPAPEGSMTTVTGMRRIADGFFGVAGVRVLRGRRFAPQDHTQPTRVAIVDERFAEIYFPGEDAIGQRVFTTTEDEEEPYEIVGVVDHVATFNLRSENRPPQLYLPLLSHTSANTPGVNVVRYIVRTSSPDPEAVLTAVRRELAGMDPNLALSGVTTLQDLLAEDRASLAFTAVLIVISSSVALVLGMIGIYGVISYVVSQRTAEIGVRMAVGARPANVAVMILRQGGSVVALGIGAGLAAAFAATDLLEAMLFDVSTTDPATYAVVVFGLLVVSLLACWFPARRAAALDPVAALRSE